MAKNKFLNRQRSDTSPNTQTTNSYIQVVEIPLSSLEDNPFQPRLNINEEKLQELMNSISKDGLQSPIKVTKLYGTASQVNTIVFGHRRVEAHKRLGLETIKAFYDTNISKSELRRLALIENIQRDDLGVLELAISFDNAINDGTFSSQKELAEKLGFSYTKVSNTLSILNLDKKIIKDLEEDRIVKDVKALALLNQLKDKKQQFSLYEKFKKIQISRKELEDIIKSSNETNKPALQYELNLNKSKFSLTFKPNKELIKKGKYQELENFAKEKLENLKKELENKEKELLN